MFTGIIEEVGTIETVTDTELTVIASTVMDGLVAGSSICVNGACLTVKEIEQGTFSVDVIPETRHRTNLFALASGSPVNLERPVPIGGRMDGHFVQGHVDSTGSIDSIKPEGESLLVNVGAPGSVMRFVVEKSFIAVDGTSLTVVNCDDRGFTVAIVPYTRDNTVFFTRSVGDLVNLEVDILAKYVERLNGVNSS